MGITLRQYSQGGEFVVLSRPARHPLPVHRASDTSTVDPLGSILAYSPSRCHDLPSGSHRPHRPAPRTSGTDPTTAGMLATGEPRGPGSSREPTPGRTSLHTHKSRRARPPVYHRTRQVCRRCVVLVRGVWGGRRTDPPEVTPVFLGACRRRHHSKDPTSLVRLDPTWESSTYRPRRPRKPCDLNGHT